MQSRRSTAISRTLVAVLAIGFAIVVSGCVLLNDDGDQLTSDRVPADTDGNDPITAELVGDDSDADNDDNDADGDETVEDGATATTEPTTSSSTSLDPPGTFPTIPKNGFCDATKRNNFDIRFASGASSDTIASTVPADEADLYWIEVGNDQIMNLGLVSNKDNALAAIISPDGSIVPGRFIEQTVAPTQAGIYAICVTPSEGSVSYELTVSVIDDNTPTKIVADWCGDSVNDRGAIRFATGAFSGEVDNAVVRGERDLYTLEAGAGQALDVFLTSLEDNAAFDLRSPSGEIIIDEVADFRIPLPEDGTYQFCIGSTRGNASYTMIVSVE